MRNEMLLCETVFDLSVNMAWAIHHKDESRLPEDGKLEYDSRALFQSVYDWAKEFERTHVYEDGDDSYLDDVDEFFWKKVEEEYPELV